MRRLLVTGGAGFIGSHFVEHWLQRDLAELVVVPAQRIATVTRLLRPSGLARLT
jgi:nucleoside-diphosphate-sugar epimerase